jgi:hypothetical protein
LGIDWQLGVSMKRFAAAAILIMTQAGAASAFAQNICVSLDAPELVAIMTLLDKQSPSETPPAGYWDAEVKILEALKANPEVWRKVRAAMERRDQPR